MSCMCFVGLEMKIGLFLLFEALEFKQSETHTYCSKYRSYFLTDFPFHHYRRNEVSLDLHGHLFFIRTNRLHGLSQQSNQAS